MSAVSPYPGLRSFDRDEADVFFGRDRCLDGMAQTLQDTRFLAVLGPSGSGKSSLVRSGLFMHLEAGLAPKAGSRWTFIDIRHPRTHPFRELALATLQCERDRQAEAAAEAEPRSDEAGREPGDADLDARRKALRMGPLALVRWWREHPHHPNENLLILIDQFEELFGYTTPRERDEVEAFVDLLLHTAANEELDIYVVLTMRSEFLGGCALFPGLAEQINRSLSLTPRMTRDECRMAITGPAFGEALTLEPLLVTTLLNDMNSLAQFDEPAAGEDGTPGETPAAELRQTDLIARRADQLPLMQHALNWMWTLAAARPRGPDEPIVLSLQDYLDLGGLRGAMSRHANEVMDSTGDPDLTSRIFRALTDQPTVATSGSAESSAVRRRRTLAQLAEETGAGENRVRAVVDAFRAEGVSMLTPDPTVRLVSDMEVDITHESLIRQWSDLRGWIRDEAEGGRAWQELLRDVGKGKPLRGLDLAERRGWWQRAAPHAGWAARYGGEFEAVDGSLKADLRAERRRKLVLRTGTGGLVAVAAMSGLVIAGLMQEAVAAQDHLRRAELRAREVTWRALQAKDEASRFKEAALRSKEVALRQASEAALVAAAAKSAAEAVKADAARRMQLANAEVVRANTAGADILRRSGELSALLTKQEYKHLQLVWEKSPSEAEESFADSATLADVLRANDPAAFAALEPELDKALGDYLTYRLDTKATSELAQKVIGEIARDGADATPTGALRLMQAETLLGRTARLQGKTDAALAAFDRATALRPSDSSDELRLARAEAYYERGSTLLDRGEPARAAEAATQCLEAAPEVRDYSDSVENGSREEQRRLRPRSFRFRCHAILGATAETEEEASAQWRQAVALMSPVNAEFPGVALPRADMIVRYFRRPRTAPLLELLPDIQEAVDESLKGYINKSDNALKPANEVYPLIAIHQIRANDEYVRWWVNQPSGIDLDRIMAIMNMTQSMFSATFGVPPPSAAAGALSDAYDLHAANWIALERFVASETYEGFETIVPNAAEAIQDHWSFLEYAYAGSDSSDESGRLRRLRAQAVMLIAAGRRERKWERFGRLVGRAQSLLSHLCDNAGLHNHDEACDQLRTAVADMQLEDAGLSRSLAATAPRAGRSAEPVWADANDFALGGLDPVVCFDRAPGDDRGTAPREGLRERPRKCSLRKGRLENALSWGGQVWVFESAQNRRLFLELHGLQAPRFGGFSVTDIAMGHKYWPASGGRVGAVVGSRLYVTAEGFDSNALTPEMIAQAEAAWLTLKTAPDPPRVQGLTP